MLFEFNDSSTNVKTESSIFGIQCPEEHYLSGYDVSGQPICKIIPAEYTVSNATIRNVLKGEVLDHTFITTSTTFVSTGFPANNKFIKKYDDSEIWVFLTLDIRNTETGTTNFIAISIDKGTKSVLECKFDVRIKGNCATIWSYDFSRGGDIQAFTGVHIEGGLKAGEHTIDLDVAVNGGTGRFQTESVILDVYEVPMELP